MRNRLEHGTDKRDRGVRAGKGEEDERRKEKREIDEDEDIIKKEERQEAKACSIGWRSRKGKGSDLALSSPCPGTDRKSVV